MNDTKIEWTDKTWNPLTGCTKVSPGCDHCYAKSMHERFNGPESFDTITLHPERLDQPLRWRKPAKVFVNSMSDLFHKDVPDQFIADVFAVMALVPEHTFQLLTKRHARMRSLLSSDDFARAVGEAWLRHPKRVTYTDYPGWPLPNVWLGVSAENQQWADVRIPALLDTPAAVRWISAEPLLGPIDLDNCGGYQAVVTPADLAMSHRLGYPDLTHLDWVVAGGESGPGARPMHPDWARSLRDQCVAAGVPFLFKQYGNWAPVQGEDDWRNCRETDHHVRADGYHWPLSQPHGAEDGTEVLVRNVGKKAAGRELDGRTWDEYPAGPA